MFGTVQEGKTYIQTKFRKTDSVICSHLREGKSSPSCNQTNLYRNATGSHVND